jgi:hypothetical protein
VPCLKWVESHKNITAKLTIVTLNVHLIFLLNIWGFYVLIFLQWEKRMSEEPTYDALTLLQKYIDLHPHQCMSGNINDFITYKQKKECLGNLANLCMNLHEDPSAIIEQEDDFMKQDFYEMYKGREQSSAQVRPNLLEEQLEELKDRNKLEELKRKNNGSNDLSALWEETQLDIKLSKSNEKEQKPPRYTQEQLDACTKIVEEKLAIKEKNGEYFHPLFGFFTCLEELYGH